VDIENDKLIIKDILAEELNERSLSTASFAHNNDWYSWL